MTSSDAEHMGKLPEKLRSDNDDQTEQSLWIDAEALCIFHAQGPQTL
jgi:hypothetical protein